MSLCLRGSIPLNRQDKKKAPDRSGALFEVEAAGIEPASRDISMKASTCVADYLSLVASSAYRQGSANNQPGAFFLVSYVPDTVADDPELRLTVGRLRRAPSVRVACVRQPVRGYPRQLNL